MARRSDGSRGGNPSIDIRLSVNTDQRGLRLSMTAVALS